ncbi:hypothetical protein [Marinobacter sp. M-5]|uniref:phosphorylase family protein n=1 Tax=Marinobacter sp. M-5 TaxID=3081089 RepID=UPI00293CDE8E|nr:hypothetical protein [Marinobacter sp. M-5]MDV3503702.1 hypothetical protein [Marinobacter sp. M-5]
MGEQVKILIVDDDIRRYAKLTDAFENAGIERSSVKIVPCANDARDALSLENYDLLIVDLLLSLWPEHDPDLQHSIDLLFEITEGDSLKKPAHIIGITGDLEFSSDAIKSFESYTWQVVEYSESEDSWVNQILLCVEYLVSKQKESGKGDVSQSVVDIAIICALRSPEYDQVIALNWNWGPPKPIDEVTFIQEGHFFSNSKKIKVCASYTSRMGMVSTALKAASIINFMRPKVVAMCGICAGVRGKTDMGDVLFADPVWDFQSGKRVKDSDNASFSIAPHQLQANNSIRSHVEQLRDDRGAFTELASKYQRAPRIPNLIIGPVASGSAVLADGEVVEDIKKQHRELIGVEMEVYGLFAAVDNSSTPKPKVFALKSVCDFADPDKSDNNQMFAAYTSAQTLGLLLERFGDRLTRD